MIDATEKFAQPHLLDTKPESVASGYVQSVNIPSATTTILGPFPRIGS